MLHSKKYKAAALILALVMVLGLAACSGSGNRPQSGGQVNQPQAGDATVNSAWYGLWAGQDGILEIQSDYAMLYHLDVNEYDTGAQVVFQEMYGCGYRINGNVMKLDVLSDHADILDSMELTLDSGRMVVGGTTPEIVYTKLSDNSGINGELSGVWYTYGAYLNLNEGGTAFQGDVIEFSTDGSCMAKWQEDSDAVCEGTYSLTDSSSISISLDGCETGTYAYWFVTNDLLRIYTDADKTEGFLLYRPNGSGSGIRPQNGVPVVQTPVSDPTTPAAPVQTQPVQTQPIETVPSVSTNQSDWYGVWSYGFDWLLEINSGYALVYDLDSEGDFFDERLCFEGIYDCNYTINGNVMTLNAYDMEGNLYRTMELTKENGQIYVNGGGDFLTKLTANQSADEDLAGTWYSVGLPMYFGSTNELHGDRIAFYQDGTFLLDWMGGGGSCDGTYYLTTKFDNPALGLDIHGHDVGTMEYEFLSNDLLMVYTDNERCYGFLLYRE